MKNSVIIISVLMLMLQSCGALKKKAPATGDVEEQSITIFKEAYKNAVPSFDYLQIKSKINADLDGKNQSASLKLYFEKDQQIWANVSMLGITGARANITPNQVQAYEIIDKTYIDSDFSFFNDKLKVDFITFDRLKQLLLGQLFLIEPWSAYRLETTADNLYELRYKLNDELQKKPQKGKYIHTFYLDSNYRLSKVDIVDSESNTHIIVDYDQWVLVEGKNFPGKVNVLVQSNKQDKVTLEYSNFVFSEMNPPFRIPERYIEREIK